MLNKYMIVIVISLITSLSVTAQETVSVSGIIREHTTQEVIVHATIRLGDYTGISNERGYFSLRAGKGMHELHVSYIGYKPYTQTIHLSADTAVIVELEEGLELDEVVFLHKPSVLQSKGLGNTQLDVAQLRRTPLFLGERDIIKMIQFLPGISAGMEGSSSVNIRGGTNDQTLFLMDDVPVYNQNHTFGFLSVFNPEIVKTADVYKGGIPAMYGNRLSGVVALFLKDGNMQSHHQSISISPMSGSFHLEGPVVKEKLSYTLAARRSFFDLIRKGMMSGIDNPNGIMFAFHDINAKLSWNLGNRTGLSAQFYNGYDDFFGINKESSKTDNTNLEEQYGLGWRTTTSSLRLTSSLRTNLFFTANAYYTNLNNFKYYEQEYDAPEESADFTNTTYSELNEFGLKSKFEWRTSNANTLFYGLEASRQQFRPEFMEKKLNGGGVSYGAGTATLSTGGVFAYNELQRNDWLFGVGLRAFLYHNGKKCAFSLEPRIKVSKLVGEKNKLMVAYDYMSQPIHSIYEMNYSVQTDFWVPFQENRIPHVQQFSFGWKHYASSSLTLSLEGYWKEMKRLSRIDNLENYLDYHTDYVTGSGRSYGLELMGQYERERWSTWLSYTLSKSTRTYEGATHPFKYDAPHSISGFISYDVWKKGPKSNSISLNMQYRTGIPYYVPSADYPSIGIPYPHYDNTDLIGYTPNYPNTRLPDYFRTDINFTMEKQLKKGKWVWQFSLLNATGHVNPYTVYQDGYTRKYEAFLLTPFMPSLSYTRYF